MHTIYKHMYYILMLRFVMVLRTAMHIYLSFLLHAHSGGREVVINLLHHLNLSVVVSCTQCAELDKRQSESSSRELTNALLQGFFQKINQGGTKVYFPG